MELTTYGFSDSNLNSLFYQVHNYPGDTKSKGRGGFKFYFFGNEVPLDSKVTEITGNWEKVGMTYNADKEEIITYVKGKRKKRYNNVGKFTFNDVKYLHPGQSHINSTYNTFCECVFVKLQFHADQVLTDQQMKRASNKKIVFN